MPQTNLNVLVEYMKTEKDKTQKQKENQQKEQTASDTRITNPNILKKYGLTESTNPQMLME